MRPISISKELGAADVDAVAAAQDLAAPGDLVLTSAIVTLNTPRTVSLTSGANLAGVDFTIYGTDYAGRSISEVLAGPAANTVETTLEFATVTQIAADDVIAPGDEVSAGSGTVGSTPPIPMDVRLTPFQVTVQAVVGGTVTYGLYYTLDDIWDPTVTPTWTPHSTMAGVSANGIATLISPVTAIRLRISAGDGSVDGRISQAGW